MKILSIFVGPGLTKKTLKSISVFYGQYSYINLFYSYFLLEESVQQAYLLSPVQAAAESV